MPPKGSKRKPGEERIPAGANMAVTISNNSQETFSPEPERWKKNADAEDGDGDGGGEVSARNIFMVSM
jgi:hypothetical protein